jgi:hypothetical protein
VNSRHTISLSQICSKVKDNSKRTIETKNRTTKIMNHRSMGLNLVIHITASHRANSVDYYILAREDHDPFSQANITRIIIELEFHKDQ